MLDRHASVTCKRRDCRDRLQALERHQFFSGPTATADRARIRVVQAAPFPAHKSLFDHVQARHGFIHRVMHESQLPQHIVKPVKRLRPCSGALGHRGQPITGVPMDSDT